MNLENKNYFAHRQLLKPLLALGITWLLFFPAFAVFIPSVYDQVIAPAGIFDELSALYRNFILACLFLRDTMLYGAITYYAAPVIVLAALKFSGINYYEAAKLCAPVNDYFQARDMMTATQIITQKTKSGEAPAAAVRAAIPVMKTPAMKTGLTQLSDSIAHGDRITESVTNPCLPAEFINKINQAAPAAALENTLDKFIPAAAATVARRVEKMGLFLTLSSMAIIAGLTLMLVMLTYIPVLQATLHLAN